MVIVIKGSKFELRINEEKEEDRLKLAFDYNPSSFKFIIDADDSTFSQGTIALLNNGNSGVIFDQLYVMSTECVNNIQVDSKVIYDSPDTHRYTEQCLGEMPCKPYDHEESEVVGEWKCEKYYDQNYGALIQSNKPKSPSQSQIPSICSFNSVKVTSFFYYPIYLLVDAILHCSFVLLSIRRRLRWSWFPLPQKRKSLCF